jgi:signal peptidase I
MLPTLVDGQILAVDNLSYRFREPQRGDVIVFTKEGIPSSRRGNWLVGGNALVKRIIALPGDTVFIENGQIFVNDVALTEDYVDCELVDSLGPITINEGELFVMGDNRRPGGSMDSRSFGPIPSSSVVGRAVFVVLPSPHKVD